MRTAARLVLTAAPRQVHVIPLEDFREHEASPACWCEPGSERIDPADGRPYSFGTLHVHNSADHREGDDGKQTVPGKRWHLQVVEGAPA